MTDAPPAPATPRAVPSPGQWIRVAMLGMAATAGALMGSGLRRGAVGALLSAAGERLRGVPAFVAPDREFGVSAFVGLAHHVVVAAGWGLVFAALAARLRGLPLVGVAALVATLAVSADRVLPAPFCIAAGVTSPLQRTLLAVVLTAALAVGMRLAQREAEGATRAARDA